MYQRILISLATALLSSVTSLYWVGDSFAQPTAIPREFADTLSAIDRAANQRQLDTLLAFYSDKFSHGDGLTKAQISEQLQALWQRYSQLQYSTRIAKLDIKGEQYIAETVTEITGKDTNQAQLEAKVIARQTYQRNGTQFRLLRQEIISERSFLSSGATPPEVRLKIPELIGVGRQFTLDAIVTQPVGNGVLLGGIVDEPVNGQNFLKTNPVRLQQLRAGGIFRVGQAPFTPGDRWVSVVLVRENGMTIASQRMRVSKDAVGNQYTPLPNIPFSPSRVRPTPSDPPTS